MTKKDIDLLIRFASHVDFTLEFIKMMRKFESIDEVKILSSIQKTLPTLLQEFIDIQDNITKIERAKDDGYKERRKVNE